MSQGRGETRVRATKSSADRRGRRLVVAPHLNPHSAMQLTGPVTPPFRGGGADTAFSFAKGSDDDVRLKRSKKRGRREEMSKQLAKANTPPSLPPSLPLSSFLRPHSLDRPGVRCSPRRASGKRIDMCREDERTWTGKEVTEGGRGRASIAARGGRKGEEKGMKSCCGVGFSRYGRKHKRG